MKTHLLTTLFATLFALTNGFAQTQFWSDNFEDVGAPSTGSRVPENNGGSGESYFLRTNGSGITVNSPTYSGYQGLKFWAGEDHDGYVTGQPEQQIDWSIDITGLTNLEFKGLFAANNGVAWENILYAPSTDYIIVEYKIDAGAYQTLLSFQGNNATSKQLALDTDGDGLGDGTPLNYTLSERSNTIVGTGATLYFRIRTSANAIGEEWAIDNFRLFHTAACTAPTSVTTPPDRAICVNNSTTFPITATGATTYQWQVDQTGAGTYTNLTDTPPYSGVNTNTLTVTGATAGMNGYRYRAVAINGVASCFTNSAYGTLSVSNLSLSGSQTNVSCAGGTNGAAAVSATGGIGTNTYSWSPAGGSGSIATGLSATTYTVTVTDGLGCTASLPFTLTAPPAINTTAGSQTNVACFGGSNGAASVTPTGGAGGYSYDWTPGTPTGDGTNSITGLSATTYTVTVTDANSCTATRSFTLTAPPAIAMTPNSQTNVSCFGGSNGAASVNAATGGTGTITYNWTPGNPTGDGTTSVTGLTAGTWTVTATDANGCVATQTFSVTAPPAISMTAASQTNVSCFGGSNGAASVTTATGGAGSFTYDWTPGTPTGDGTTSVTGLSAGTYTVTATDVNGCTKTQTFTITQPPVLAVTNAGTTNVSCLGAANGAATVGVSGGQPGYTYSWSPAGGTGATASGLTAGNYTVTVTDANSCVASQNFTLTEPATGIATSETHTDVSCNNGSNGVATVTATGGTGTYTYSWSPAGGTAATASGLTAGTYVVTVTDANTCSTPQIVIITQPDAIVINGTQDSPSCNGSANGSISATVTGGTGTYTYAWSPSGGNGATATGLADGSYTLTVTDQSGCIQTASWTITEPSAIAVTPAQTNVSCNSGTNGSATVTVTGGTGTYTYSWSPAGGNGATANNLTAGSYTVTITDANLCTTTETIVITEPTALAITSAQTDVSCNGLTDGTASVTVTGGTGNYTYSWAPAGGTAATATDLAPGTYTVTITDDNGCGATPSFVITEPTALALATTSSDVNCNGGTDGSATATVTGGTGDYTYSWSPAGGTAATAADLSAGTYTVTATDESGCTINESVTITEPATALTASATAVTTALLCNGDSTEVTITATGGTPGYTGTGTFMSAGGTHMYTVTDDNGCTAEATIAITQPDAITVIPTITFISCHGGNDGQASVAVSGGTGAYTYTWTPGVGTGPTISSLTAGVYEVSVLDANGCAAADTFFFIVSQPAAIASSQNATLCPGQTITVGTNTYSTAGTYTDVLEAANGCDSTVTTVVTVVGALNLATTVSGNVITAAATGVTYQWINCANNAPIAGATAQSFTPTANGNYAVIITGQCASDTSDCVEIITFGLDEIAAAWNATLYPNPSNGIVTIDWGVSLGSVAIEITDVTGKVIYTTTAANASSHTLELSQPTGIYYVRVSNEREQVVLKLVNN